MLQESQVLIIFTAGMISFVSGIFITIFVFLDRGNASVASGISIIIFGLILLSIVCVEENQISDYKAKVASDLLKSQISYLDSTNCDQVKQWLSNSIKQNQNATQEAIQHARDILISECLK